MSMKYSFNQSREGVFLANAKDLNASFKDLGMACAAIRYKSVPSALATLESTMAGEMPIYYAKHNKHMGSRHQLGGKKGRWPMKCAAMVRKVLINAVANAQNNGIDADYLFVVHAAANKTMIARRMPPKGALFVTGGPSGQVPARHTDLEFARVEVGVAALDEKRMSAQMVTRIKDMQKRAPKIKPPVKKMEKKPEKPKKSLITKKEEPKTPATVEKKEQKVQKLDEKPQQPAVATQPVNK